MWGAPESVYVRSFYSTAKRMFEQGGIRVFILGSASTLARDLMFGAVYAGLRHELLHDLQDDILNKDSHRPIARYVINMVSACCATILSSPMNYVRNIHYSVNPKEIDRYRTNAITVLWRLWKRAQRYHPHSTMDRWHFLQLQLRIGWGTARVGVGMAFSEQIYNACTKYSLHLE